MQPGGEGNDVIGAGRPVDDERFGLPVQPEPGERGGLGALRLVDQFHHAFLVGGSAREFPHQAVGVPVEGLREMAEGPVQVHERLHRREYLRGGRLPDAAEQILVHPSAQGGESVRVAPAQVGCQYLAHHVVREEPRRGGFDEGLGAQPGEQFGGALAHHRPQEGLGGDVGLGADLQRGAVCGARRIAHESWQQRRDHVPAWCPVGRPGRAVRVLPHDDRGSQGQGQRIAAGEGQQRVVCPVRYAAYPQESGGIAPGQVPQRHDVHQAGPSRVGDPARIGGRTPGDHRDRAQRQPRQEVLPQPVLQALTVLERIDQEHRSGLADRLSGGLLEVVGRRRNRTAVDLDDQPSRFPRLQREPPEQRGLADSAGPVQIQHGRTVRVPRQRGPEHRPFRRPPDERPVPRRDHEVA